MSKQDEDPLLDDLGKSHKNLVSIPIHISAAKKSKYRLPILLWLSLQTTCHSLLLIYSRSRPGVEMYLPSVAVFFTELLKVVSCCLIIYFSDKEHGFIASFYKHVLLSPNAVLNMSVPAILYTFQTNLLYIAASHLDPATFIVLQQLKIFSSAISSLFLLNRRLSAGQWSALLLLFTGICIVQMARIDSGKSSNIQGDKFIGFIAVATAAGTSGFAGVYMERQLKSVEPVSIWMRNIQMGIAAIPASFCTVLLQDGQNLLEGSISFVRGFDFITCLVVASASLGGLSVAACIKFADNIAKDFASATAIVLTTLGSVFLFNFKPTGLFALGALCVMASTYFFSRCGVKKPVPHDHNHSDKS